MAFKSLLTGIAAAALAVSPTMATAQTAVPTQIAPALETVEADSQLRRTGFLIPFAAVVLVLVIILLVTQDDDEEPVSP